MDKKTVSVKNAAFMRGLHIGRMNALRTALAILNGREPLAEQTGRLRRLCDRAENDVLEDTLAEEDE